MPLPTVVASEPDQLLAATVALLRGEVDVARHLIDRIDRDALWLYYDAAAFVYEARHDGQHTLTAHLARKSRSRLQ